MNHFTTKERLFMGIVLIASTFSSCEKEIDVNLHSVDPHILIEGIVKQDSLARVKVSHTLDFNNQAGYPFLKGAIVKLSDNTGYAETLQQDTTGWYVAENLKGEVGKTYNLSVTYDNTEYTAISHMPPQVEIDSLSLYDFPFNDYPFPMVHFKDPLGSANQYYLFEVFINGKQHTDGSVNLYTAEHTDGNYIRRVLFLRSNDDDTDLYTKGDTLLVEMQSVDKGAFTFFETWSRIDNTMNNPTSNITGGALGYFNAYAFDKKSIVVDWKE